MEDLADLPLELVIGALREQSLASTLRAALVSRRWRSAVINVINNASRPPVAYDVAFVSALHEAVRCAARGLPGIGDVVLTSCPAWFDVMADQDTLPDRSQGGIFVFNKTTHKCEFGQIVGGGVTCAATFNQDGGTTSIRYGVDRDVPATSTEAAASAIFEMLPPFRERLFFSIHSDRGYYHCDKFLDSVAAALTTAWGMDDEGCYTAARETELVVSASEWPFSLQFLLLDVARERGKT
jgi:hypothetical protein